MVCARCQRSTKKDPHSTLLSLSFFNPKNMGSNNTFQYVLCEDCINLILEVLDNPTIEA